nr:uncharacterized protein LOC109183154 [Ipomoea batatas]
MSPLSPTYEWARILEKSTTRGQVEELVKKKVMSPPIEKNSLGELLLIHCRYGHNTGECQAWRKEIEALIQSGQLGSFIDWNRMHQRNVWKREVAECHNHPTPPKDKSAKETVDKDKRPVINVIFGGWSSAGGEAEYVESVEEPPVSKRQRRENLKSNQIYESAPSIASKSDIQPNLRICFLPRLQPSTIATIHRRLPI